MVRSKYTFEKRQKEIARKKKHEEKAARRSEAGKERENSPEDPISAEPVVEDHAQNLPQP